AGRARLPLLVLDSMLPGQELDFWTDDKTYLALMADVGVGGSLGMLGMDPRTRNVLRHGVEVTVTACQPRDGGVYTVLSGQRVFRLPTSSAPQPVGRWRRAYAEGSEEIALGWGQEQFVEEQGQDPLTSLLGGARNREALNQKVGEGAWEAVVVQWLTDEPSAGEEAHPLASRIEAAIPQWLDLVRSAGRERREGQLELIRETLGQPPPVSQPRAFALWAAALINPLPSLGVALEIRPAVLAASSGSE
ncbi:unnamed protein product, partial [Polarella glacialis]